MTEDEIRQLLAENQRLRAEIQRKDRALHTQSHQMAEAALELAKANRLIVALRDGTRMIHEELAETKDDLDQFATAVKQGYQLGLRFAFLAVLPETVRIQVQALDEDGRATWWAVVEHPESTDLFGQADEAQVTR